MREAFHLLLFPMDNFIHLYHRNISPPHLPIEINIDIKNTWLRFLIDLDLKHCCFVHLYPFYAEDIQAQLTIR